MGFAWPDLTVGGGGGGGGGGATAVKGDYLHKRDNVVKTFPVAEVFCILSRYFYSIAYSNLVASNVSLWNTQ